MCWAPLLPYREMAGAYKTPYPEGPSACTATTTLSIWHSFCAFFRMQELDVFPHLFIAIHIREPLLNHNGVFRNRTDGSSIGSDACSLPHGVAFSVRGLHHRAVSKASPHNADQIQLRQ